MAERNREPLQASRKAPAAPTDNLLQQHRQELQERFPLPPVRAPQRSRKAAQGALALFLAAATLLWLDPAYRSESYASTGQRETLLLADCSQAVLDTYTQLKVSWHLRSRQLTLLRGQVRLAVQRQPWRPLRVDAGLVHIEVLGTTFNVLREQEHAQVSVVEGLVAVADAQGTGRIELHPGEQLSARSGSLGVPQTVDVEAAMAWTQGRLIFQRTPLADALDQMRRYHPASIRLNDPRLASLPVSGASSTARVAAFLKTLPALLPVEVTEMDDGSLSIDRR